MKKLTLIAMAMATLLVSGCTSYSGISKADKPGSYYITTNSSHLWVSPGVSLCNSTPGKSAGDLKCREVNVDY